MREFEEGLLTPEDISTLAKYHEIKEPKFYGRDPGANTRDRYIGSVMMQLRRDKNTYTRKVN